MRIRPPSTPESRARDNAKKRERYATDPAYRLAIRDRNQRSRYGTTAVELLERQGGVCGICGTRDPGKKWWHIDHDHACCPSGKTCGQCIRGVLCTPCNTGIGMFRDDADLVAKAASYLTRS